MKRLLIFAAVAFALALAGIAAVVLVPRSEPTASAYQPVTVARKPPPASVPAQPETMSATTVTATFRDNVLDECDEVALSAPLAPDAGAFNQMVEKQRSPKSGGRVRNVQLSRACATQFAGRPWLATCVVSRAIPKRPGWHLGIKGYYYNAKTVTADDTFMRECLEMGGDWQVSENADQEEARQRLEKDRQLLEKAAVTPP